MSTRTIRICAVLAALSLPAVCLAKRPEVPAAWRLADVTVDGSADEWTGKLMPVPDLPLSIGVQNDASFLYVCVRTSDENAKKQILAVGLSLYFDAGAGEDRGFGVRYPLGREGGGRADVPDTGDPKVTRELERSAAGADIEILGRTEADLGFMRVADANPIEAALGEQDGALVIELKIPLTFSVDTPHAVDTKPGSTISLGIDTAPPKVKTSRRADDPLSGAPAGPGGYGGGSGGGYGRGSGGGRAMGGGHGRTASKGERDTAKSYGKPLKAWITVPLAAVPKG
jgi:hypothetical protein